MIRLDNQMRDSARSRFISVVSLRALTTTTLILTYLLIVLGSTVRVTESGMGCAGWPLCSGQLGPIYRFHPLLEQSHRYLASIVTVLIIAVALLSWRGGSKMRNVRSIALLGVGAIVVQVVLGAITVFTNNAPVTVALHLMVGLLFLAIVTVTAVRSWMVTEDLQPGKYHNDRLATASVTALFFVLISGSLVVDGGAQSACQSWPFCFGSHTSGGLILLQLTHRAMVFVGATISAFYFIRTIKKSVKSSVHSLLATFGLVLLALEILVGITVAVLGAPDILADVHLSLAAALWIVLVGTVTVNHTEKLGYA